MKYANLSTAVTESKRRYWPTIKPSKCSDSWRLVALVKWSGGLLSTLHKLE